MKFFILQVAGVILFASSNALISYFFTPEKVTLYGIAYRYFSITMLLFTVIAAPFWSATTDAYTRKDFDWIKKSMRKLHFLLISLFIILAFMIIFSDPIYHLWVGKSINISLELSASMALYMFIIICSLCYSYILNGIGALKIQLIHELAKPFEILFSNRIRTFKITWSMRNCSCIIDSKFTWRNCKQSAI